MKLALIAIGLLATTGAFARSGGPITEDHWNPVPLG